MLTLYAIAPSLYCAKLRIVLRHKGLEWREIPPPGGYGSAEYRRIVASGNLPALIDGDLLLADSEVIAEYLDDTRPSPAMLPETPAARAQARERGRLHDSRLEPALRRLFPQIHASTRSAQAVNEGGTALNFHLQVLARHLDDAPLPRDRLWLGDCGFAISLEWIRALEPILGLKIDWPATVSTYREGLRDHPAVGTELNSYLPHLRAYLDSAV